MSVFYQTNSPASGRLLSVSARIALCALTLAIVFQNSGKAADDLLPADALPFSLTYTVTGDFAVASVDLLPEPDNADGDPGFQTGTIHVGTTTARLVPQNAEILAAFMYWETLAQDPTTLDVQFRGLPVSLVRVNEQPLTGVFSPCWSQSGNTLFMMRADVLSLLPLQMDDNGFPTGRRLVNDMDLTAAGLNPGHTVRLPEAGTGNQTPQTAGASLFLVYRDPAEPLRRIVVHDGLHILEQGVTGVQRIRGFLQSAAPGAQAKLTQIIARGQIDASDQMTVTGAGIPTTSGNLFAGNLSPSSDRAWASPTTDVSVSLPGAVVDYTNTTTDDEREYGEQLTMTYAYGNTTYNGCHTWAAIAFSTTVEDDDGDGLIDLLEEAPTDVSVFKDPNRTQYPKLWDMGASVGQKDLFVEVNSMYASPGASYGSATHPFPLAGPLAAHGVDTDLDSVLDTVVDSTGHDHRPTPAVVQLVGDALGRAGVAAHFDMGDPTSYVSTAAQNYVIGAGGASGNTPGLATGGESILETPCVAGDSLCQFPAFRGTVGWKYELQLIRDAWEKNDGTEFTLPADQGALDDCVDGTVPCRRRFDPIRNHIFHYLMFAHARGMSQSVFPCLDGMEPVGFPLASDLTTIVGCVQGGLTDNPDFHVPRGVSGVSDLPGFNSMVTLGLSTNFLGTDFFQASTALHELGHSFELWHGGVPPVFSPSSGGTVHVDIAANCKPNYQSSMSYLHQLYGLIDQAGAANIDFSNTTLGISGGAIDETTQLGNDTLVTGESTARRYRIAWYMPIVAPDLAPDPDVPGNLAHLLGVPEATRHCDGTPKDLAEPPTGRLQTESIAPTTIDWAGDDVSILLTLPSDLDVNFDGRKDGASAATPALAGIDDLDHLRLNQLGGGQNAGGFSVGIAYVGTGLTVDGFPYLGGPQYIGGVVLGGSGAFPTGGVQYPTGEKYLGGIVVGGSGVVVGGSGVVVGGSGVVLGGSGIALGGSGVALGGSGIVIGGSGIALGGSGVMFGVGGAGYPIGDGVIGIDGVALGGSGIVVGGSGVVVGGSGIVLGGSGIVLGGSGIAYELTHEDIVALGYAPPNQLNVCVLAGMAGGLLCDGGPLDRHLLTWAASNQDTPDGFLAFRATGGLEGLVAGSVVTQLTEQPLAADATSYLDEEELPSGDDGAGVDFIYWTKALFNNEPTGPSVLATVRSVNVAPTANPDTYVLDPLALPPTFGANVFDNDDDPDIGPSGKSNWAAILVDAGGAPIGGVPGLTLNANGSFTYNTSFGAVTFYYEVDTQKWTDGTTDMSPDSNVAMVTISIPDVLAPTITNLAVSPATIWSPNGKKVAVTLTGIATDTGGSGLASILLDVEDEYNLDEPDGEYIVGVTPGLTYNPGTGAFSLTFQLTASRLGSDKNGRVYTLRVQPKDGAGNLGAWVPPPGQPPLTVTAHDQSKK